MDLGSRFWQLLGGFSCDQCSTVLSEKDIRYHCEKCEDFDLCSNCAIDEEGTHEHPLTEIKPKGYNNQF